MSTGDSEGVNTFLFNIKNGNDDDEILKYWKFNDQKQNQINRLFF